MQSYIDLISVIYLILNTIWNFELDVSKSINDKTHISAKCYNELEQPTGVGLGEVKQKWR